MTRSARAPLLSLVLLAACGPATPAPAPPVATPAAPAADVAPARHAADVAIASLSRRKFNVAGCTAADARVVPEAETAAVPGASESCTLLVAHRADGTWVVVVRSATQTGNVWALVTVSAGGEGVQHIDYKP
jgi:hypothetical protein